MNSWKANNDTSVNIADINYTGIKNSYPEHIKQKAIKYYHEGNKFRKIERLIGVSHVSVIS